jgi:hypothetical protein
MNEGGTISAALETPQQIRFFHWMYNELNELKEYPWIEFPDPPKGTMDVWDEVYIGEHE